MVRLVLSHAHKCRCKLFTLSGLGKRPGTWTRMPQLQKSALVTRMFAILVCLLPCIWQPDITTSLSQKPFSGRAALLLMSLLEAGTSVNLCFLIKKKCFAERFPNLLLNPYLKVGWKEKERERDLLLVCPDECSLSGFGIRNGKFILLVTSTLRFYAFP